MIKRIIKWLLGTKCKVCNGTGYIGFYRARYVCPVCMGKGKTKHK